MSDAKKRYDLKKDAIKYITNIASKASVYKLNQKKNNKTNERG